MTQLQFQMIVKIISDGAPVLADELCTAVANLIDGYGRLETENADLKAEIYALKNPEKDTVQSEEKAN